MIDIITGTAFDSPKRLNHREDEVELEFPSSVTSRSRGLLALRGMMWGAARKSGPTARDYVQNGLVAMWDGIENVGWGTHDDGAQAWVDLVGGISVPLADGGSFGPDSLVCNGSANPTTYADVQMRPIMVECVARVTSGNAFLWMFGGTSTRNNRMMMIHSGKVQMVRPCTFAVPATLAARSTLAVEYASGDQNTTAVAGFLNAVQASVPLNDNWSDTNSEFIIFGCRPGGGYRLNGEICAIRCYSRALSVAELTANYHLDQARFGAA